MPGAKKHRYFPLGMVASCCSGGVGRTIRPEAAPLIRLGCISMCVSLRNLNEFATLHVMVSPQRTVRDDPRSTKLPFSDHGMSCSCPMSGPNWKTPRPRVQAVSSAWWYRLRASLVGNERPSCTLLTPDDTKWLSPASMLTSARKLEGDHRQDRDACHER